MLGQRSFKVVAPDDAKAEACERMAADALEAIRGTYTITRVGCSVTINLVT